MQIKVMILKIWLNTSKNDIQNFYIITQISDHFIHLYLMIFGNIFNQISPDTTLDSKPKCLIATVCSLIRHTSTALLSCFKLQVEKKRRTNIVSYIDLYHF